jgi:hypothetical protein
MSNKKELPDLAKTFLATGSRQDCLKPNRVKNRLLTEMQKQTAQANSKTSYS